MNGSRQEDFKPIPVTRGDGFLQGTTFALRQWVDLQLLTCTRFLKPRMAGLSGNVLDVGCGEMPFRSFLPNGVRYQGLDIEDAAKFGMHKHPDVILFDGTSIPFPANSCDAVLCTEVLEHVANPELLVAEMMRVLRPGGARASSRRRGVPDWQHARALLCRAPHHSYWPEMEWMCHRTG
ncbi:class I SAM-dependent methyltransferase [Aestuariivirga sp.]|uniref:class I SAM-dependent methyltransferase n=1 Tax=Aestuariivirga sp. TaxID=2650926 RepID=UPI0030198F49